jgi:hypothetical protein
MRCPGDIIRLDPKNTSRRPRVDLLGRLGRNPPPPPPPPTPLPPPPQPRRHQSRRPERRATARTVVARSLLLSLTFPSPPSPLGRSPPFPVRRRGVRRRLPRSSDLRRPWRICLPRGQIYAPRWVHPPPNPSRAVGASICTSPGRICLPRYRICVPRLGDAHRRARPGSRRARCPGPCVRIYCSTGSRLGVPQIGYLRLTLGNGSGNQSWSSFSVAKGASFPRPWGRVGRFCGRVVRAWCRGGRCMSLSPGGARYLDTCGRRSPP